MGFNGRIDSETRAFIKLYHQKYSSYKRDDIPLVPWLAKKCKVSVRSVYRLIKEPVGDRKDKEKKGGRKRILSTRTENRLIRNINKMRHMNKNWIVRDLMAFCDIDHVSERTVQRILNENGYGYRHARRKGVLTKKDPTKRIKFAKKALKDAKFTLFPIPPRSPELNPIENVFALVKKNLMKQVIDCRIERESFDEFSSRVKSTLYSTSTEHINNMIDSYGERLRKLISKKGCKIEY